MFTVDRRTLLAGSGLALALTGRGEAQVPRDRPANEEWNHGDDPWNDHPGNYKFNPLKVCILHMELLPNFALKATRFHYYSVTSGNSNNWDTNKDMAAKVINWLNDPTQTKPVEETDLFHGLNDFKFGQPHHVVIYIKNKNIKYPKKPIWFGKLLQGTLIDPDGRPRLGGANENHSFFRTQVQTPDGPTTISGDVSKELIYFENHHHKYELLSGHKPIPTGELKAYSLNISVISQSVNGSGEPDSELPIIIDPDTGNMGGGEPEPYGGPGGGR